MATVEKKVDTGVEVEVGVEVADWQMGVEEFNTNGCTINMD